MTTQKRLWLVCIVVIICALLFACLCLIGPVAFSFKMRQSIRYREKELLYHLDHEALAEELRNFSEKYKTDRTPIDSEPKIFWQDDRAIPACLRILKPSSLTIYNDRVEMEFGGTFLHFGIAVFGEGIKGYGTKVLGRGIWFYSDDQTVPKDS